MNSSLSRLDHKIPTTYNAQIDQRKSNKKIHCLYVIISSYIYVPDQNNGNLI